MSTYTPIASVTLSSAQSSVTFSGIPQTYTDLVLVISGNVNTSGTVDIRVGNNTVDSGSNYSRTYLYGNGTSAISVRNSNLTETYNTVGTGTVVGNGTIHFMNYSNTTTNKTFLQRGNDSSLLTVATVSLWRSTSAINIITITGNTNNLNSGTTLNLYGVANASITNVAKATGGDSVTTDGTYWYHTFRSSGTFTPTQALTCDLLVVAGGGGSADFTGGGGGGQLVTASSVSLTANTAYTTTIGAGGTAGAAGTGNVGTDGNSSSLSSTTASGGLKAPGYGVAPAGAWPNGGNSGSGNVGGNSAASAAGGGGGNGAVGNAASGSTGGTGGAGTSNSITGTSITYGGGGGGAGATGAAGGSGGGGTGGSQTGSVNATAGTTNTGGGAGGGIGASSGGNGGKQGGSGIVIVRYSV